MMNQYKVWVKDRSWKVSGETVCEGVFHISGSCDGDTYYKIKSDMGISELMRDLESKKFVCCEMNSGEKIIIPVSEVTGITMIK